MNSFSYCFIHVHFFSLSFGYIFHVNSSFILEDNDPCILPLFEINIEVERDTTSSWCYSMTLTLIWKKQHDNLTVSLFSRWVTAFIVNVAKSAVFSFAPWKSFCCIVYLYLLCLRPSLLHAVCKFYPFIHSCMKSYFYKYFHVKILL